MDDILIRGMEMPRTCEGCRLCDDGCCYVVPVLDGGFDVDLDELPKTKDAILQMIQTAETIVPAEGENADDSKL